VLRNRFKTYKNPDENPGLPYGSQNPGAKNLPTEKFAQVL
jgi:hypothetical protein